MRRANLIVLFAGFVCAAGMSSASARQPYFDEFKGKYAGDDADPEFAKTVTEAKCFICHVGKSKKNRNAYGTALSKVIAKKEMDKEKIREALGKIEKEKSADGTTFGELIKDNKLPGGPPKKD
jgi:hypothetical protein